MRASEPQRAKQGCCEDPEVRAASPFEALVVDFGGVLTTPLQEAMIAFAADIGIELPDLIRVALAAYSGGADQLVVDFETGRIPEGEFAEKFAARIKDVTGVEVPHEGLVGRIFATLKLEDDMLRALEIARSAGYKTAMLSNSWGEGLYPRERIDHLFDVMVISGEIGMRKPDPKIFEITLERLGIAAERCIFVDDHPGHLATAAELGMTTVLHRTPTETLTELSSLMNLSLTAP